jgi:glutathione synthase/RimK-type ligase-like ATP-grasp enzyme
MSRRLLISGGGTGASNNLIRSLRAADATLSIAATHDDRFVLKRSAADRRYLVPSSSHPAYARALGRIIRAEKTELMIPTSDGAVAAFSRLRERFPSRLFLPRRATIAACQDKYTLSRLLREQSLPAPLTFVVESVERLDETFRRLGRRSRVWCRIRTGSGSMGAIPVTSAEQARTWITHWQAIRGVPATSFTLSEYLPGRDFGCQSVWKDGTLVLIKTYERLSYLGMGSQATPVSSIATLSKTVIEPRVADVCVKAIRALDPRVSGVFSIDLKENASGVPCITDINAGRFSSATAIYDFTGKHNMAITYVRLALDEPVELRDEYDAVEDYYMLRDVDALPVILHADELFDGIHEQRT